MMKTKEQKNYAGSENHSHMKLRKSKPLNQTMFDVLDPLIVHVLLLTHEIK